MDEPRERLIIVMLADIPEDGINAFQHYEGRVLPILDQHGGRLERRLRTADSRVEVHIVSFDTRTSFYSYMADPTAWPTASCSPASTLANGFQRDDQP